MGKNILITEKPSVAMEFAKALKISTDRKNGYLESEKWLITWCVGHLVTMSYPEKYNDSLKFWRLETLPFIPKQWKYEVIPAVQNQFNTIKTLLDREDIETIYVSTDSGREGEYIYRLVDQMIGVNEKVEKKRVWIDSQTEEEIIRGIKEAKDLSEYDSLSDSAYLRAKEDYLIGINFSRLLTLIYGKSLANKLNEQKVSISVGRVMTCVLGLIVSREREIRNFKKTKYYKIILEAKKEKTFKAEWKVNEKSKYFESPKIYNETGFKKEEDAKTFINSLAGKEGVISELKKSKSKEKAPLLFNLAEIQNECTKRFKIGPGETLEIIQNLYEKKLVTYPRTDARVISTAVAKVITKNLNGIARGYKNEEVAKLIQQMKQEKYSTNLEKTKYVNDKKITDHYAIIPTGQGYENFDKLPDLQKQIYDVIVRRFLAIFFPPAEYSKIQLTINVDNELFHTSGKICVKRGYQEVLKPEGKKNKENTQDLEVLKDLKKGEKLEIENYELKEAETSPPSRYNSSSLVLAMENAGKLIEDEELREQIKGAGIGTSATRAGIIEKLERIKYIAINKKTQIVTPTQKGEGIYDVIKYSMPDMLNPKLTASWEKGLDMVAKKSIEPEEFMTKLKAYINSKFKRVIM